jgi:hypothetical protein
MRAWLSIGELSLNAGKSLAFIARLPEILAKYPRGGERR